MLRSTVSRALSVSLTLTLWWSLPAVADATLGDPGSPQTLQDGTLLFPNETRWAGQERDGLEALASIISQSHTMAMVQMQQIRTAEDRTSVRVQQLAQAYRRNLQTARMAHSVFREHTARRNGHETTLYYDTGRGVLMDDSRQMRQLEAFARACLREADDREVIIVAIGSTSPDGVEAGQPGLAATRVSSVKRALDPMLTTVSRTIHAIAGFGGMYGAPASHRSRNEAYQHVRLTAVYEQPTASAVAWSTTEARSGEDAYSVTPMATPEPEVPPRPAAPAPYYRSETTTDTSGSTGRATATVTASRPMYEPAVVPEPGPMAPPASAVADYNDPYVGMTGQNALRQNDVGMRMVYIPPGTFMMGSPKDELGRDEDERHHQVTLSKGFYLQSTEVTQRQWIDVMGANPSHFENCGMDCPVESITWHEAQAFVDKVNAMHNTRRYRLPTEAEWEYACRAGSPGAFYRGEMIEGECGYNEMLDAIGWYHRNAENGTHPVGMKDPNAWGLYDMHGNVWEWCGDREGEYAFTPSTDPSGPSTGLARVRRGGSWSHYPMFCRAANRSWHNPNDGAPNLGLRLAMDVNEPEELPEPEVAVEEPEPTPATPTDDCEVRTQQDGNLLVRRGIPDARAGRGAVSVERIVPAQVKVGEPTSYRLILRNLTECEIILVTLTEHPDRNFHVTGTKPEADSLADGALQWQVRPLEPGGTREFIVMGNARADGDLEHCATADFRLKICTETRAVSPRLEVTAESPAGVMLCEEIPITVTVRNPGSGVARDVNVTLQLSDGLVGANGQQTVTLSAGDLGIDQSREFRVSTRPQRKGTVSATATATAADQLRATDSTRTSVTAPVLRLTKTGPAMRYAGRPAEYTIRIANAGDAPAENTEVRDAIPAGMQLMDVSEGGVESGGGALWSLGTLAPGASKQLSIRLMARDPGTFTNTATASATCAEDVQATAKTRVAGIAAILLEVVDETDPLEVGGTGRYIIVATNQGSAPCTNLKIICGLEENLEYVSSSGATRGSIQNGGVHFAPLDVLEPKAKATWYVEVRAVKAGDVRFRARLQTDQLNRPVEETEATTLY